MKAGQKGKGSACCPWASTAAWGSTALCHRSSPKAWAIPRAAERKESWMKRVSEIGARENTTFLALISSCWHSSACVSSRGMPSIRSTPWQSVLSAFPSPQASELLALNPCQSHAADLSGFLQNPAMARCSWFSAWTTPAHLPPSTWSFVQRNSSLWGFG